MVYYLKCNLVKRLKGWRIGGEMLDTNISLIKTVLQPITQKLLGYLFDGFSNKRIKVKFYRLCLKKFEIVVQNAGLSLKKINGSDSLRRINHFFFQSINKGYPFSNKDIALILAKENIWRLDSIEITQLATTFCQTLLHSIERDDEYNSFFRELCIISNLKDSNFNEILNDRTHLNKEYYEHFSKNVRDSSYSHNRIRVYFCDEIGANRKSEKYSIDVEVNIFSFSEICSAFFTEDAYYFLYEGNFREQLKLVGMDKEGNIKLISENKSYGTGLKNYKTLWEL